MRLLDKVPLLQTAFCGNTIRNGSLFIGWLCTISVGIVWSVYMTMLPSMFAYAGDYLLLKYNDESHQGMPSRETAYIFMSRIWTSLYGLILTYIFILKCLLLYGVLKNKHYFLLPWILVTSLSITLELIASLILFILGAAFMPQLLLILIPLNLVCGISTYFVVVISSFYRNIRDLKIRKTSANQQETTTELV